MAESLAAVLTNFHQPLETRSLPIPDLEPGSLLVRVDAATLCGTDVHIWEGGMPGTEGSLPFIPGHEATGTVVEMNGERRDVVGNPIRVGDRIIWSYTSCGQCYYCSVSKQVNLCPNNIRYGRVKCDEPPYLLGGCAEHHYVPVGCDVIHVPDEVSPPLAASAACALRTVMHGFERLGGVGSHETVLVQGCGPVGLYAAAVARDRGARRVLVIGAPEERLEVARAWGADGTLNLETHPDAAQRKEWVNSYTGGRGPDIVIQCATTAAIPEGLDLVRTGGRYLSIGGGGGNITVQARALQAKYLQVIGIAAAEGHHFYKALEFLASKQAEFPFARLITGRYSLDQVTDALQAMKEFKEVKPVVLPNGRG